MSTVNQYKIYCITESAYVYGWSIEAPIKCYNSVDHQININSVQLENSISQNVVTVKEDKNTNIGRNVYIHSIDIENVAPLETKVVDYVFDLHTSLYSFKIVTDSTNKGDEISIIANPDTVLGLIPTNVTAGATSIGCPPALLLYGFPGFYVSLSDGTNTNDLGYILTMNKINSTITFQRPPTNNFLASNTVLKMSVKVLNKLKLGGAGPYYFAEDVIGGASLTPGVKTRYIYKNNSMATTKSLYIYLTILF